MSVALVVLLVGVVGLLTAGAVLDTKAKNDPFRGLRELPVTAATKMRDGEEAKLALVLEEGTVTGPLSGDACAGARLEIQVRRDEVFVPLVDRATLGSILASDADGTRVVLEAVAKRVRVAWPEPSPWQDLPGALASELPAGTRASDCRARETLLSAGMRVVAFGRPTYGTAESTNDYRGSAEVWRLVGDERAPLLVSARPEHVGVLEAPARG